MLNKKVKSNKSDILETAKKRFRLAEEAEHEIRTEALDDLKFRKGDQWPEYIKQERDQDSRPCLVINRTPQFLRQITNDQRQNRPSIKVHPVDDKADIETAKIYQGLIRHIEYNSNAEAAYDTAFEGAAQKGFGYYRLATDYVSPMSFEQEILIKRIRDHFSVYLDPNAKEPDGSDANWGFIFEDIPKEDFEAEYPDSELASADDWSSFGDTRQGWVEESNVRIAEYFYKEFELKDIVLLENGETILKSQVEKLYPDGIPEGMVKGERKAKIPVVHWCKINGVEILEETIWLGQWIPIFPVYGDELIVDGKRILEGVIRHAKDPQRMYNYFVSSEAETIGLSPRAPYIVAEGQIPREYESQWKTANKANHAYLPYKPIAHGGVMAPPPQRNVYEAPVQAITNARMQAAEDMKATTGVYDAALGNRSNETSGVAIQRRNMQAQTSNFHYVDNLTRSLRHCGRCLVDLIPKIYDTERAARIVGEEGDQEVVRLNQEFQHKGEIVYYDLSKGKYDVVVETGPGYATKRQEAAETIQSLVQSYPNIMQIAGDLMVKNMDWPGATEIAERLKKTLAPGLAEDKDQKPLPPEVEAQMQQMNQMIEELTQGLNEANEDLKTKRLELESKERIAFAEMENDLQKEKLKADAQFAIKGVEQQIQELEGRLQLLGINQPIVPTSPQIPPQEQPQPTGGFEPGYNPQGDFPSE